MALALAIAFLTVPFLTLAPAYADDTATAAGDVTATEVVDPPPGSTGEEPPAEEPAAEEPAPAEPAPEAQEAPAPEQPAETTPEVTTGEPPTAGDAGGETTKGGGKTARKASTVTAAAQQTTPNCSASFSQNTQENAGGSWINGNLNSNNSEYAEGDFVPQRVLLDGLSAGTHTLTFSFDRTKDSKFAYDYVAHLDIQGSAGASATWTSATSNFAGPAPVGTVADYPGTTTVFVTIEFTIDDPNDATAILRWDGHIASELDYGFGNGASSVPGSPYHFSLVSMSCGNVGQQDNQLQASAVQFGTIVVVKDAVPNAPTPFDFDLDALNSLHDDFVLTDDGSGTDNTYTNHVPPGAVTLTETPVDGWNLTDMTCTVAGDEEGSSVTVTVADHTTVTCTFTNSRTSTLEVDKYWVINGGDPVQEGSEPAGLGLGAQLTVDGDNQAWDTALDGYLQGTSVSLDESVTFGNDLCDWAGTTHGSVTEVNGETPADATLPHGVTLGGGANHATITNEVTCSGALVLKKAVENTNGGTAVPGDFTLVASPAGGGADLTTPGSTEGHEFTVPAGQVYDLTETDGPANYTLTGIDCGAGKVTSVQVPAGETRTCTFTNHDGPGSLTLVKLVEHNGTGDDAEADDWTLTATPDFEGQATISGTTGVSGATKAGTYDLSESGPTTYDASAWSCLEGDETVTVTDSSVDLAMGQDVTCTITNTARSPHLTLVKIVDPLNAQDGPEAFTLTATAQSGSQEPLSGLGPVVEGDVMVGTYDLSETGPEGYDPAEAGWQCVDAEQAPVAVTDDAVTLEVADRVTCTIVNVAVPATVEVDKYWSVNGGPNMLDGTQPADLGLEAQLLVNDTEQDWGEVIGGFLRGAPITLDETVTVGNDLCRPTGARLVESHGSEANEGLPYDTTVLGGTNHYTILNTVECASELTLVKVVDHGNTGDETDEDAFTLSADPTLEGEPTLSGAGGASSAVSAGDYVLSETGPTTYAADLDGWTCTAGEEILEVTESTVTVPLATSVTCTIINRAIPSEWTVSKTSDPPSGSTVQPGEQIDYTVTLSKVGNGVPVEEFDVIDTLTGVEDGWVSGLDAGATITDGKITWHVEELGDTPLTLTYTVTVGADAWNSEIDNVLTPGPVPCLEIDDEPCDHTEHFTPHYTLDKAVELLAEGGDGDALAEPGEHLEYTLTIHNDTEHAVVDTVITDDVSDVVDDADIIALGDNLSYDEELGQLTWTVEDLGAGKTAEVTYVVEIKDGAWGVTLRNVATPEPDDGGECVPPGQVPGGVDDNAECETTTETPPVTTMVVEKRDLESDEVLAGATFEVWSLGAVPEEGDCDFSAEPGAEGQVLVGTAVTEDDGQALFHDLQHGCYLLVETAPPAGYELPEDAVMGVQVDELNFVAGGEMAPIVVTDFAEGHLEVVAKKQYEKIDGSWVESDGRVGFGDTVRYEVRVKATGPKNFHDVKVIDYVPGFNPEDTVSTLDGTLVEGSAHCSDGLTCTAALDPDTQLVTWSIGDLEPAAGEVITGTAVMDVVFPEVPADVFLQPEETYTATLWNIGELHWFEAVRVAEGDAAPLARTTGGGAGARLATAATIDLDLQEFSLVSNEVVVSASITAPPEHFEPGRVPHGSPLPQTGAPAGLVPLGLGAVVLIGAGLLLTRRRKEE